jgi:hypothetical protein
VVGDAEHDSKIVRVRVRATGDLDGDGLAVANLRFVGQ